MTYDPRTLAVTEKGESRVKTSVAPLHLHPVLTPQLLSNPSIVRPEYALISHITVHTLCRRNLPSDTLFFEFNSVLFNAF